MLIVACVNVGNYRGMGAEYVANLYRGVRRHLNAPFRFVCLTDSPLDIPIDALNIEGSDWYAKMELFRPGRFGDDDQVLFFDLDTVIIGNVDELAAYDGEIAGLSDFYYPDRLQSSVLSFKPSTCGHIWTKWERMGKPRNKRGDQGVIEVYAPNAERFQDLFPDVIVSFKADCESGVPLSARVVCFHGEPKPDNCPDTFLQQAWRNTDE